MLAWELVTSIILKFRGRNVSLEDVRIQEGNAGLIDHQKLDCRRGLNPVSTQRWWIRQYTKPKITKHE
ncbi:MAG: hypothetical protein NZ961_01280 [Candidatus Poribacteria bacterium]|nr:hypothetical protein [Candidatus Poribacteria bacterium]